MAAPENRPDPFGLVGRTLEGQYRIEGVIGEGGFSVVYRARHLGLNELIAIKCLKLEASLGAALIESFVHRFRDEGRILYRLSQGNLHIVRCIASGTTVATGTNALVPYTVLEWLEGRSLADELELRRAASARGRTVAETIELFDTAVDAVAYAHAQGVVHRDLNPGNVFLTNTRDGVRAKVLDFGIAKVVSDHALELGPRLATMGHIRMFAPAYAAPEQLDERYGSVGPWTDVYTLAVVFLEVLRDQMTVEGDTLGELVEQTLRTDRRPTPKNLGRPLGDEFEALFSSALSLDPKDRPQDAGAFWGALKHAARLRTARGELDVVPTLPLQKTLPLSRPAAGAPLVRTLVDRNPPRFDERETKLPTTTLRMRVPEMPGAVLPPSSDRGESPPLADGLKTPVRWPDAVPFNGRERVVSVHGALRVDRERSVAEHEAAQASTASGARLGGNLRFYLLGSALAVVVVLFYVIFFAK